jgi:hypothetical protein
MIEQMTDTKEHEWNYPKPKEQEEFEKAMHENLQDHWSDEQDD